MLKNFKCQSYNDDFLTFWRHKHKQCFLRWNRKVKTVSCCFHWLDNDLYIECWCEPKIYNLRVSKLNRCKNGARSFTRRYFPRRSFPCRTFPRQFFPAKSFSRLFFLRYVFSPPGIFPYCFFPSRSIPRHFFSNKEINQTKSSQPNQTKT